MPSSSGGHVMQVAALQAVMPKSPEYSPASPSPPRVRVVGRKVSQGKKLRPPLDQEERESIDSNPGSVLRFRSPPPIRGLPEVYAYMDSDDDEEEERNDIAALREQLMKRIWMSGWRSPRSTGWI